MAQERSKKAARLDQTPSGERIRRPVLFGVIGVSLALIAGFWYLAHPPAKPPAAPAPPPPAETTTTLPQPASHPPGAPKVSPDSVVPAPIQIPTPVAATPPPAVPQQPGPPPLQNRPLAPGLPASAYTRSLIGNLTNLDLSHGPITAEQAQTWKQNYDNLVKAGAESVPAIREFLAQNLDINFKALPSGDPLGASSMRLALFDALRQIGGADALALSGEVMQTTASPREIGILAANLDAMAPEQYRESALAAARVALANAALDPSRVDVGPLLQVLQKYGGTGALADFQTAASKWNYYAPIALAGLPDGGGIPVLAQMAQNADGSFGSSSRFALQMLAQLAPQYPEAANALASQLKNAQLPNSAWIGIASALSGDQVFYSDGGYLNTAVPPADATGLKTWHMAATDQNWQSVNVSANWTPQQIQYQLNLIDQLIAANPSAAQSLQATRSALAARLSQ